MKVFFWIPDPKHVIILKRWLFRGWGEKGWNLRNMVDFVNFSLHSYSMFHPLEYGSYRYMDKPHITKSSRKPRRYSITTSLMVSTLKNIISQIGMKINIWNYHLDKRCTHGLSLSLTPRLGLTSIKRACFRLSTKIWSRCHIRRLSCS